MSLQKRNRKEFLTKNPETEKIINALLEDQSLTKSTRSFVLSVRKYYFDNDGLTKKQHNALMKIHLTSLKKKTKDYESWATSYDEKKRQRAIICARYYEANPPYFGYLSNQILAEKNFIPTKTQFKSICENKYSKKVLEAAYSTPLFNDGDVVEIRKNAPIDLKNKMAVVINSNEAPIVSAAKGAKVYILLPFGEDEVFECEERFLKKSKNSLTK